MLKRRLLSAAMAAALGLSLWGSSALAMENYIYRSTNKLDFIKLDPAKGAEKQDGLNHPYTFDPQQMRDILGSIHFNKKVLILKNVENRQLFDEQNVEFLAPYLIEAFQKVKPDQVVTVSYFTRDSHLVIQNDRLTVLRAFVKNDGLHIRFTKLYAKLLGDRVTLGEAAAASQARGMRVSLELQEGQNRISWSPEELVFDLNHFRGLSGGAVAKDSKGGKDTKSSEKTEAKADTKPDKKEKKSKKGEKTPTPEEAAAAEAADKAQSIRARLKELEQLKKDEMITNKEYEEKRRALLKEL